MSFARFSDTSDVYVFAHYQGFVQCCGCLLGDDWDHYDCESLIAHLQEHVEAGHKVPVVLLDPTFYDDDDFKRQEHN